MPSLRIFGHKTCLAGDDLRVYTLFALALRVVQLAVIIPLIVITNDDTRESKLDGRGPYRLDNTDPYCRSQQQHANWIDHSQYIFIPYLVLSFVLCITGIGIEVAILRTTGQGTPTQPELRWRLKPLCIVKMVPLSFLRCAVFLLGLLSVWVLVDYCECGNTSDLSTNCPYIDEWETYFFCLAVTHAMELCFVGMYGLYFFCKTTPEMPKLLSAERKWQLFCKCCCTCTNMLTCCLVGGGDSSVQEFLDVALVLSEFFDGGGVLDVVLSDIVVGLTMLKQEHETQAIASRRDAARLAARRFSTCMDTTRTMRLRRTAPVPLVGNDKKATDEDNDDIETGRQEQQQKQETIEEEPLEKDRRASGGNDDGTESDELDDEDDDDVDLFNQIDPRLLLLDGAVENDSVLKLDQQVTEARDTLKQQQQGNATTTTTTPVRKRNSVIVFQLQHRSVGGDPEDGHHRRGAYHFEATERTLLSKRNADDRKTIAEGARFMRFAAGIYLFKQFQYTLNPCVRAVRKIETDVIGDAVNVARLMQTVGLDNSQVVYAQLGEGLVRTPYSILLDHSWKSVVVTFRGTLSLDDVVADLTLRPESLSDWGERLGFDGSEYYCHKGVLKCVEWIYEDLEKHGMLDKLLLQEDSRFAGYQLRLLGHSLGAGIAAVLSFFLKAKFPTLKCLCFCPPGCTVSLNMADDCKDYLTSFVLGDDIVPRLSLESMEHVRDDILEMIARIKVTKHQAMNSKDEEVDALVYPKNSDEIPQSQFRQEIMDFYDHKCAKRMEYEAVEEFSDFVKVRLYPPGKIVHIIDPDEDEPPPPRRACCLSCHKIKNATKKALPRSVRWAQREDLAEVLISSHFVEDHKSENVLQQLERAANEFGLSSPFVVEEKE